MKVLVEPTVSLPGDFDLRIRYCEVHPGVTEWQQDAFIAEFLLTDAMLGLSHQQESLNEVETLRRVVHGFADIVRLLRGKFF